MLFNSYTFMLLFMPLMLVGWWILFQSSQARLAFLAVMSWAFYSYHDFPTGLYLLPILLASTTADYIAGGQIVRTENQRIRNAWLVFGLGVNLGFLCLFKYLGFFTSLINFATGIVGDGAELPVHHLVLPLGISFYTFNSMSYTIDIWRRQVEPAENFIHYCAFVALFPHLVAGPIVRYSDIDQQFRNLATRLTSRMVAVGGFFVICGLFKKVVISDTLDDSVNQLYANTGELTVLTGWATAIGYYFQLYFDYSGYGDMAVGLALLLGFKFPQAFNSPFRAQNISDFWKRWNMTLTRWVIDYVFIPLGGSRVGTLKLMRNVIIVSVLMGMWHGATWTFALAGFLFGCATIVNTIARRHKLTPSNPWVCRMLTFATVASLFSIFRSPTLDRATDVLSAMYGANGLGLDQIVRGQTVGSQLGTTPLIELVLIFIFVMTVPNTWEIARNWGLAPWFRDRAVFAVGTGILGAIAFLLLAQPTPFLYFEF